MLKHGGFQRLAYAEWASPQAERTIIVCVDGLSHTAVEFADCGHAPALMDDAQIALAPEFLFPAWPAPSEAVAPIRLPAGSAP